MVREFIERQFRWRQSPEQDNQGIWSLLSLQLRRVRQALTAFIHPRQRLHISWFGGIQIVSTGEKR